ncbi:hypothetical protein ISCGN_025182 [Ixodes scapularis]
MDTIPAWLSTQCHCRPLASCRCHTVNSAADRKPPSANGVLLVPQSQVGDQPKTALGHWCSAGARIPGRWPTQSHPRPLASCRCHDIISVADPKPPSAIGVLLVPGFQVGGRPKSALGHWCSANATMPARWPTQYRPWPLVFCRCPAIGAQPMPEPGVLGHGARPSQSPGRWAFLMPRDHNEVGTDLFGRAMADENRLGHGDMAILRPGSPCYLGRVHTYSLVRIQYEQLSPLLRNPQHRH